MISILIPCHNARQRVGAAIGSALAQSHPHCEVIVVDDGSTDGSLDVIRAFGDRIKVLAARLCRRDRGQERPAARGEGRVGPVSRRR